MSDEMAFGALVELRARGLQAGVDVALMGVDDHEFASVVDLTTVRQMVAHQGAAAARALIGTMEVPAERRTDAPVVHEPFELIVRSSTRPSARNDHG
jgi:DNA-binding LacI/PurR family transcriptional regulator